MDYHKPELALNLYTGVDYFRSLTNDIVATKAGDRVAITTMGFDPSDPIARSVIHELSLAASRNVSVTFGIDAFAIMEPRSVGPLVLPYPIGKKTIHERYRALEELNNNNVTCGIINMPNSRVANLFAGRSHMKLAVVNSKTYIGGPSFQGCDRLDMVVGFEDQTSADFVYDLSTSITEVSDTAKVLENEDKAYNLDDKTKLFIDSGKPGQSLILQEGVKIVDEAKEWLLIGCQFLPTGIIGKRLEKAMKRGVEVHIAYNHPSKYDRMNLAHSVILALEKIKKSRAFFANQVSLDIPPLHTKALANENVGMVGSHNLIETGVKFGTPEISLARYTPKFAQAVRELLLREIEVDP
ncbi:MAG TPA: hypothetical protein VJJ78_02060 [Candidatus Saccharimonadales bacterium]|nr:hypothetical protein [Candidatus Saccharimonadales bacterium]